MNLDEIKKAIAAASPGPWRFDAYIDGPEFGTEDEVVGRVFIGKNSTNDARLISNSRQWLPELVSEVERLRAENARLISDNTWLTAAVDQLRHEANQKEQS